MKTRMGMALLIVGVFAFCQSCHLYVNNIGLDDLEIDHCLYYKTGTNLKDFADNILTVEKSTEAEQDEYVKKYLGEDNLLSFIMINSINDYPEYDICETGRDSDPLCGTLLNNETPISKNSISNLKVLQQEGDKLIGQFDYNIVNVIKGRCMFLAIRDKNKMVVKELRIAKKGSDILNDGIQIYPATSVTPP